MKYVVAAMLTLALAVCGVAEESAAEGTGREEASDARQAVFVSAHGNADIDPVNSDGSGPRYLTNNSAKDLYPSWPPKPILFPSGLDSDRAYVGDAPGTGFSAPANSGDDSGSAAWWIIRLWLELTAPICAVLWLAWAVWKWAIRRRPHWRPFLVPLILTLLVGGLNFVAEGVIPALVDPGDASVAAAWRILGDWLQATVPACAVIWLAWAVWRWVTRRRRRIPAPFSQLPRAAERQQSGPRHRVRDWSFLVPLTLTLLIGSFALLLVGGLYALFSADAGMTLESWDLGLASPTATVQVTYQELLNGRPSPVFEAQAEDGPVALQLLGVRETTEGQQTRLVVPIGVRNESNHSVGLSAKLGFTRAGTRRLVDATEFRLKGARAEDVEIHPGALEVDAAFLIPETARRTYLDLELDGNGSQPIGRGRRVRFVFD